MTRKKLFEQSLKTIGLVPLDDHSAHDTIIPHYAAYIKILYLPEGYELRVDFNRYRTDRPSLFFVAPNQVLHLDRPGSEPGCIIFYNRDFYCIQLNDDEVACDGLLFNNTKNMPMTALAEEEAAFIRHLLERIEEELEVSDSSQEEMIRTYLKQLLIKSTRVWKKQHLDEELVRQNSDLEFFRRFTMLVDAHYKEKHNVADYAGLLRMAPKTLTHRFRRLNLPQPNEIIKNRIILEAKRLLVHTTRTSKEIAYDLGYDDPAYFSRIFQLKTGESPSGFRTKFLAPAGA
ncbi:MAG TPA: helix-turn-helix domain-containing protein [Chitinophagaceae bacterium]|jgi:AraC-like DNA-binding protein|nr:helix-turn-helix domain-containing protein [Chitinophagaceae bacterium]